MEIFCFFLGILYQYTLNHSLLLITVLIFYITPKYPVILFFSLGIAIAWFHQWLVLPRGIPDKAVIPKTIVQGTIASIPQRDFSKTQFLFALDQLDDRPAQGLIQLAWYTNAPDIHAGERWQFAVKLKKPRNFLNPGSENYARSLAARHVLWTGYIKPQENKLLGISSSFFRWLELREHLGNQMTQLAPTKSTAGVIEALTLNLTTHISQKDWELFRRTGTTHLFGISGEHIALISGMAYWLLRWIWSQSAPCCLLLPAPYIAGVGGLFAALFYSFLAGFGPPVQRALIGCFFYTIYSLGKQWFTPWQVWRYALFGVLCIEPHVVFMQGFYFSFLASMCLLLTHQRWRLKGYKGKLALQGSCFIGLMPLTLYWYSYSSINGFIANLFAIPLVGFLIVPLALITMSVSSFDLAKLLMKPLSLLITLLFNGLSWIDHVMSFNFNWSIPSIELVVVLMGALLMWILMPIKPLRWVVFIWLILPFFQQRAVIQPGEALIHVLDVGQGLAVIVRTQNHILIYDTGDKFFKGNDMAKMVILPYLKTFGIKKINTVVISHPDKDHRGGLHSLEDGIPVEQLLVNDPGFYKRGLACHNSFNWQWDNVHFYFLPIKRVFKNKNNNSCILQIKTDAGKALFPGDIEKKAEDYLVKTYGSELSSDLLIVPHHGSKTSSSYRFLLEIAPRYAVASLGFDNRFHFPHARTLATMNALNIPFYRTDTCGMVEIILPSKGEIKKPICFNKLENS